tara:strand:- start:197 stop:382 length:186 start_codon:yes stop_codon:yes gene_type:complete
MEDNRTVTSAKYQKGFIGSGNVNIVAVIDGKTIYVPLTPDNTDRKLIQAWEDDGNTIQEAD